LSNFSSLFLCCALLCWDRCHPVILGPEYNLPPLLAVFQSTSGTPPFFLVWFCLGIGSWKREGRGNREGCDNIFFCLCFLFILSLLTFQSRLLDSFTLVVYNQLVQVKCFQEDKWNALFFTNPLCKGKWSQYVYAKEASFNLIQYFVIMQRQYFIVMKRQYFVVMKSSVILSASLNVSEPFNRDPYFLFH